MKITSRKHNIIRILSILLVVTFTLMCRQQSVAFAAESLTKDVKLSTLQGEDTYDLYDKLKGMKDSTRVIVQTSNPEVANFTYTSKETAKKNAEEIEEQDSVLVINGTDKKLENGYYLTELAIVSQGKGTAIVTLEFTTDGITTTQTYNVTVKGYKPKLNKIKTKKIRTCDRPVISIENLSKFAKITLSCNKNEGCIAYVYDNEIEKKRSYVMNKKAKTLINYNSIIIEPKKTGSLEVKVKIEQDGYVVNKKYKFDVKSYVNPIKSFVIGNKEYARYFDNADIVGDDMDDFIKREISIDQCKYALGNKFQLKMKEGYTLVKISYRNAWEYGTEKHTLSSTATRLPKKFWELHIDYKDKNGKIQTSRLHFTAGVFMNQ